jgi:hypothetical protein
VARQMVRRLGVIRLGGFTNQEGRVGECRLHL